MFTAIHREVTSKVVPFMMVMVVAVSGADAQVSVRGTVVANNPCELQAVEHDTMCAAVQVPLQATLRMVQRRSLTSRSTAAPVRLTVRSAVDGRFRQHKVPAGEYSIELRDLHYAGEAFNVQDFVILPGRVRVSNRRAALPIDVVVVRKATGASTGKLQNPNGAVGTSETREVIGDCGAVPAVTVQP